MTRSQAGVLGGVLLVVGAAVWLVLPSPPPPVVVPAPVAQPPAPLPPPRVVPDPAPHPSQPLPPDEALSLPMADGNPLRAHWYAAPQPDAPVLLLDVGAGQDLRPWQVIVQALLAQRPAHVLWLDDVQLRHPDATARATRALARWRAGLAWLQTRAPQGRLALVAAHEAADAVWAVTEQPRPLSLAVIAPEQPPPQPLPLDVVDRFALVALPVPPTPTWLAGLHNVRVLPLAAGAAMPGQFQSDVTGWLFVALGPR